MQHNLGNALTYLGEQEADTQNLEKAVTAFRKALEEWTQERVPLDWAMTQHNLGIALTYLGARQKDVTLICKALEHGLMAWDVYSAHASSYGTSAAEGSMKRSLMVLKTNFEPQIYEACLAKHQQRLKQIGLS
jgi:tetratricopeptide (TPR) repeat protein